MDAIQKDFEKLYKQKQKNNSETASLLDFMISTLKQSLDSPHDPNTMELLQETAGRIQQGYKETQINLHKYVKSVDKKMKIDLDLSWTDALENKEEYLDQIICRHFIREGRFNLVNEYCQESSTKLPTDLISQFNEMFCIVENLKQFNIQPCLAWCQKNHDFLNSRNSTLQFSLHKLEYLKYLQDPHKAIQYAKLNFTPFVRHIKEIQQLLCSLLYRHRLEKSPYKAFAASGNWQDVQIIFCRDFCALQGLGSEPPLQTCSFVGTMGLPIMHKMAQVMKVQPGLSWTQHDELAIDIPLQESQWFHTVFACPVSKEQSTKNNPPMIMTCGHVISKESLMRLCKGNMSARFKCPYCPCDTTASQSMTVHF